ncbi:MAG: TetR/AcrR family transcriptional regulator [Clostridiaceae bacterium]|nr:TetR/AcrR family transcriptional regulator [Clostridiaceae bacterium]
MRTFVNESFNRLDAEKRERIIRAAIDEFSDRGYELANTNRIAERAGISVGSLFSYFDTKENLFLYIVQYGSMIIEQYTGEVMEDEEKSVAEKIEYMVRLSVRAPREEKALLRLYHEMSSLGNNDFLLRVPHSLESFTAGKYIRILEQGQKRGEVRADLDVSLAAFTMDNVFMSLQKAYSCDYYMIRLQIYTDPWIGETKNDERVISETLKFLYGALLIPENERKER